MPDITANYERPFDFIAVLSAFFLFIHVKYYIVTKHSQIVNLVNVHILVYQHAKCDCMLWKLLWFNCAFWEFLYIITCLKR